MNANLFTGELVRLGAEDPEPMSKAFARWERDTEFHRLLNDEPAYLWSMKKWRSWLEKELEKETSSETFFAIRTLEDDRLIGFIALMAIEWNHGDAWVAIGLGERMDWGKGYGTDAMRLVLQYAFTELNLYRVSLGLFDYNSRAQRSYEKVGFLLEGRQRQLTQREGQRWDMLIMGILQPDWQAAQRLER
jgi:RimJ/RimL family protein N-acetyltransferase